MESPIAPAQVRCLNCEAELRTPYCGHCGQHAHHPAPSMREIARELGEEVFHLESKLATTLKALIVRPGFLTAEHWRGRRASYVGPLRLYFAASVLFFLVWAVQPPKLVDISTDGKVTNSPKATSQAAEILRAKAAKESGTARRLIEHCAAFLALGPEEMMKRESEAFERMMPKAMFVLIPVFALMLKVLYRKSKRVYAEHFIFALHFHAFAFVALALSWLAPNDLVKSVLQLGLLVYLFLALRRAYGEGRGKTLLKEFLLTGVHGSLLGCAVAVIVLVSVW